MEISLNQEAENVMVIIPMIPQFGYALFPLGNLTFLKEILNELNEYLLA
jgi:hypothetical protein